MFVAELQLWEQPREYWLRSLAIVSIFLLNVADVITTQMMLARGGTELNPLSAWLIDNGALVTAKMALVSFIAVAAAAASPVRRLSHPLGIVASIYVIVVALNTFQLVR